MIPQPPAPAPHALPVGNDCVQPACWTSQTMYLPGARLSVYVPPAPVAVVAAMVVSAASFTPLPFTSTNALMVQPDRPASPASLTPFAFESRNLTPVFVACW